MCIYIFGRCWWRKVPRCWRRRGRPGPSPIPRADTPRSAAPSISPPVAQGSGFRVQNSGFRVQGSGFGVEG